MVATCSLTWQIRVRTLLMSRVANTENALLIWEMEGGLAHSFLRDQ